MEMKTQSADSQWGVTPMGLRVGEKEGLGQFVQNLTFILDMLEAGGETARLAPCLA